MKHLATLLHFLQGTYAKFGTTSNLLREITLSVLTAVLVAVAVQLFTPAEPSPIAEVRALAHELLQQQQRADSVLASVRETRLRGRIDSLTLIIQSHHEKDSMRANAGLSDLDAMRKVNGAIAADRQRARR